jgi:hypothetical protein
MAPAASTPATATAVYVAAVPLRASKGPAQLVMSAGYSLGLWDLQHFMVLLRPDPARTQALVFDFQPQDPEDVGAALAVLSRSEIPGKKKASSRRWIQAARSREHRAWRNSRSKNFDVAADSWQLSPIVCFRRGSEKNAAEDPGQAVLARRALLRRGRRGRRRQVQRAVADRPGRRGARLPGLHQW